MYALGSITLKVEDTERKTSVVEVLNTFQRSCYSFGTIDFGDREKLTAIVKITDRDGNLVEEDKEDGNVDEDGYTVITHM